MTNTVYLSLGSNLGNRERNISDAYRLLSSRGCRIVRYSSPYYSEPWGFVSEHDFVNTVVKCETSLTPRQLLEVVKEIEIAMGRTRKSTNGEYHDRIIDIDILLYNDLKVDEPDLVIPHPLMQERDFVMTPFKEVAEP